MSAKSGGLKTLASVLRKEVDVAVYAAAEAVVAEAQHLITSGSGSGGRHVPSLPGQPPNNDLGHLKNNIKPARVAPLHAIASSNAEYASHLEFGTSKMAPRPYMIPARDRSREAIIELVQVAIDRAVRKI